MTYSNGSYYDGMWEQNLPSGENCVFVNKNNDSVYRGGCRAGLAEGEGKYAIGEESKPEYVYQGTWKDNKMHGKGVETKYDIEKPRRP